MEEIIGSCVKSFLGPYKGNKFIIDDQDITLTCCPFQYFKTVSLEHPMGYLLEESLCAHHEEYGTGTTTLLAMWYFWQSSLKQLVENGVLLTTIVETMQMGLEFVVSNLRDIYIPLETNIVTQDCKRNELLVKPAGESISNGSSNSKDINNFPRSPEVKFSASLDRLIHSRYSQTACNKADRKSMLSKVLMRSRHFDVQNTVAERVQFNENPEDCTQDVFSRENVMHKSYSEEALSDIVKKMSHGYSQVASLLSDAWILQCKCQAEVNPVRFTTEALVTCVIPGMSSLHSSVENGLILKVTINILNLLPSFRLTQPHKVLIINGDATQEYTHLGFSPEVNIHTVSSKLPSSSEDTWVKAVISHLHKLDVTVVLTKGKVDPYLMDALIAESILIIDHCPYHTLKVLAKSTRTQVATYIIGSDELNVANNITLECWKPHVVQESHFSSTTYLLLNVNSQPCHTVVLCHPSPMASQHLKHQFWHVANRLQLSTYSGHVLPGGGHTELYCAAILKNLATGTGNEKEEVLNSFLEGFTQFYETTAANLELGSESSCLCTIDAAANLKWNNLRRHELQAYDCLKAKTEAWRTALKLNLLFLQTDAVIVNGYDGEKFHTSWKGTKFVGKI